MEICSIRGSIPVKTYSIIVQGRVQGIGFRPFIYNQAQKLNIKGYVKNTKQGVLVKCQGKNTQKLINILKNNPPRLSNITKINITTSKQIQYNNFLILKSSENDKSTELVQIMPDLAVCSDCIADIENPKNRRHFYPFTNCTQCGPRYSIIRGLPYDRPRTTMQSFKMCNDCYKEYNNPTHRRFHAQPNACPICGPQLRLTDAKGNIIWADNNASLIKKTQELLRKGKIVAIRSIGGFQIVCDAKNNGTVMKLRNRKNRPAKPLAIMCNSLATVKLLCHVNQNESNLLKSQIAPIVLLKKKKKTAVSPWIAPKNNCFGVMLPYTPLHKLIFAPLDSVSRETLKNKSKGKSQKQGLEALVMTSANPRGAPIIAESNEIIDRLRGVVDCVLDHNRPIESRCDDSVVFDCNGPIVVRYSRGYVPEPLFLENICLSPVLAFGSDLKNGFAIGQGNKVYLSPYIGDLMSADSINYLFEMLGKYQTWFNIKPEVIACDLHPDYISVRLAEEYARKHGLKLVKVQHHYGHLAGVMAEHGLIKPVIGIGYDGTGYGTDNAIWGSEIMVLDYAGFERLSHLKYLPLVGGDVATTNPRLIAKTYLSEIQNSTLNSVQGNPEFSSGQNSLLTSSMARLFDAVASILGACHKQTFEGEAPIALEAEAMKAKPGHGYTRINTDKKSVRICVNPCPLIDSLLILQDVLALKKNRVSVSEIALRFHEQIISDTISIVKQISKDRGIKTVCLSGGVFQNRILLAGINTGLIRAGFKVYTNRRVPINDGGIAFGQAIVAGISQTLESSV